MLSLIKYAKSPKPDVYWGRAELDGLPFRGKEIPKLKEEEFTDRTIRTFDARNGTFNTADKAQNEQYLEVLDKAANGWWTIVYNERWRDKDNPNEMWVYVEWLEGYIQAK